LEDGVESVPELWAQERSSHASTADRPEDVERLIDDSPGYPRDREIGRRVRNL